VKYKIGSAKHHGAVHKKTAWRARGRGRVFDGLNKYFSRHTINYATQTELALIRELMPSGRLLDLGCGTGRVLLPLSRDDQHEVVGVDMSMAMLEALHGKAEEDGRRAMTVLAAGASPLPFGNALFDGVYSFGMISHYVEWNSILEMIGPHLKPGAAVLFDLAIHDQGNDSFSKATRPSLGGFVLVELPKLLAEKGFVLDRVMPQRFGSSADITASWFDHQLMIASAFGEMHTIVQRVNEKLLADEACTRFAIQLDLELRRLLSYRSVPSYRAAASQLLVVRRLDEAPASADTDDQAYEISDATRASALRELLQSPKFAACRQSQSFMRYLCLLDPFLRSICGGERVVAEMFPEAYEENFPKIEKYIGGLVTRQVERTIRVKAFRTYRRGVRRLLALRNRFA
jgi:SAM-dependent methyltransferase